MEIHIPLPESFTLNTYAEMRSYLKQLELAVHHAQKSIEHAEKDGVVLTDDSYISFEHPSLDKQSRDDLYDELQNVELKIVLK